MKLGTVGAFIMLFFLLLIGFSLAAALTWLISLTGLFAFSWGMVFVVWGIVVVLRMILG